MVDLYKLTATIEGELTETEWERLDDQLGDGRLVLAEAIRNVLDGALEQTLVPTWRLRSQSEGRGRLMARPTPTTEP